MELIATFITGIVSLFLAILKNGHSNKLKNQEILSMLKSLTTEMKTQSLDLLQLKMDKYIIKNRTNQSLKEEELKELSKLFHRYKEQGGNSYYDQTIAKIITNNIQ